MATSKNKTVQTGTGADAYFAAITDPARRADCEKLSAMMSKATGEPAKMWGPGIVGFGSYHYKYESGREGDMCKLGFASRKDAMALYGLGIESQCRPGGQAREAQDRQREPLHQEAR